MSTTELSRLLARPEWHARAECRGLTQLMFPTMPGGQSDQALAVCARCPVRAQCEAAGLDERYGVWGGHRKRLRERGYPT